MSERRNAASLFSHSLKTPLSSVKVASQLLLKHLQGSLNAKDQQLLEMIFRNATTLEVRINRLIQLSVDYKDRIFVELTEEELEKLHDMKEPLPQEPPQDAPPTADIEIVSRAEAWLPQPKEPEMPANPDKIVIHADPEIADLIPRFLDNRAKDIDLISSALEKGDWESVKILGHSMKGAGGGYGFYGITDIGRIIEDAARIQDTQAVQHGLKELSTYLSHVEVIYDES